MKRKLLDLDAQIAALEAAEDSSLDGSGSDSSSDSDDDNVSVSDSNTTRPEGKNNKVLDTRKESSSSAGIVETLDDTGAVMILKSSISGECLNIGSCVNEHNYVDQPNVTLV
jgi:hypothetical protein